MNKNYPNFSESMSTISSQIQYFFDFQQFFRSSLDSRDVFQSLFDLSCRSGSTGSCDRFNRGPLGFIAYMGIKLVNDFGVGSEDGNDDGFRNPGFGAKTGEGMAQAVKSENRGFLFASFNGYGRFNTNPANHPHDIDIDEAIANGLSPFVCVLVSLSLVGTYISVDLAFQSLIQNHVERRSYGNRDLFPGFELLDKNPSMSQINVLPLEQNAILQTLSRVHADIENDLDFIFVVDAMFGIIQNRSKLFFLFASEGDPPDNSALFFTIFAEQNFQCKGIFTSPVLPERCENFPQPLDFPVVRNWMQMRM